MHSFIDSNQYCQHGRERYVSQTSFSFDYNLEEMSSNSEPGTKAAVLFSHERNPETVFLQVCVCVCVCYP